MSDGALHGGRLAVLVAGAGASGLAAAHRLTETARARGLALDLTVLEAADRAGGVVATERAAGYLVEAGPDSFVTDRPWALDLCRRLGLGGEIVETDSTRRRSFVYTRGRLLPIPEGYQLLAPARFLPFATSPILGPLGRLRAAADLVLPRRAGAADESLASFVTRRFGRQTLERLAQPLLAGIYDADPERLSLRATMPRFLDLEARHRSVILGLWKERRRAAAAARDAQASGARYSLFVTLRTGLETLIDRLVRALPAGVLRLGERLVSLEAVPGRGAGPRWRTRTAAGRVWEGDAVILGLPGPALAPILAPIDGSLASLVGSVPYGGSTVVSLGYRAADLPRLPDGFGFVVPRGERRRIVACSFSSLKFAGRAPAGEVLLRVFVAGGVPAEACATIAGEEIAGILGATAAPRLVRVHAHRAALPRYEVGHLETVRAAEERLARHPGLFLAGNVLRGVGLPDCVRSGESAADATLALASMISLPVSARPARGSVP